MEDAVNTVALVEKAVFHLIDRETETVESFKITFCGSNHRIRFDQRQADQSGPLIRMTLRTSLFIDQVEICPLNRVIAMTDDALRRASFKRLSMRLTHLAAVALSPLARARLARTYMA